MPKDTKTLGNSKARACESLGFVHKKGCARVLTQPLLFAKKKEGNQKNLFILLRIPKRLCYFTILTLNKKENI